MSKGPDSRQFLRAPVSLAVHYRTKGSFLMSYSLNLSKGGIFLETPNTLPLGTTLQVRFTVPGANAPIELESQVVWVRETTSEEGFPPGLGLQFNQLESNIGVVIDGLIQDFTGVRLMALSSDESSMSRLKRMLEHILSCEVIQDTVSHALVAGLGSRIDMIFVDLDSSAKEGIKVIRMAQEQASSPLPAVALTREPRMKAAALAAGASAVLENPPPYDELRQLTMDVLSKPSFTESTS